MNGRTVSVVALSLAAGCVDAAAFLASGVFPANMTGNTVVLGISLVRPGVVDPLLPGIVLAAFCVGTACGALMLRAKDCAEKQVGRVVIIGTGTLILTAVGQITLALAPASFAHVGIAGVAFAMGLQAAAVAQLGIPGVSTVVVTGTLTTVIRQWIGAQGHSGGSAATAGWTWVAYLVGAIIGAAVSAISLPMSTVVAAMLSAVAAWGIMPLRGVEVES